MKARGWATCLLVATSVGAGASFLVHPTAASVHRKAARPARAFDVPVAPPVHQVEELQPVVLRRLLAPDLTPALIRKADEVLWKYDAPVGTEIVVESEGRPFIARFEQHYHEVGGPQRPWGVHKGVTLYAILDGALDDMK